MSDVVLFTGLPGVGKLTVARELVRLIEADGRAVKLVDNHYWNNVIFDLLDPDGETPLGPDVWERVFEVGEAVWRTIEEQSPRQWSFVMTAAVEAGDEWFVDRIAALAERRGSDFTVVALTCSLEELERRITARGRAENQKMTSVSGIRELYGSEAPSFDGYEIRRIDTTDLPPRQTAGEVFTQLSPGN